MTWYPYTKFTSQGSSNKTLGYTSVYNISGKNGRNGIKIFEKTLGMLITHLVRASVFVLSHNLHKQITLWKNIHALFFTRGAPKAGFFLNIRDVFGVPLLHHI